MNKRKLRVNKKLFIRRLFSFLLSLTLIFLLASSVVAKDKNPEYKEVVVKHGDTLWAIAKTHYGENVNIEKAMYVIKKSNKMTKSDLYPGIKLKIPVNL